MTKAPTDGVDSSITKAPNKNPGQLRRLPGRNTGWTEPEIARLHHKGAKPATSRRQMANLTTDQPTDCDARRRDSRGPEWAAPQKTPELRTARSLSAQRTGSDWSKARQRDPSDGPRSRPSEYRHLVGLARAGWSKHRVGRDDSLGSRLGRLYPTKGKDDAKERLSGSVQDCR